MAMFGGKKAAIREPPVDRVRVMMRGGMSEKDIVRQLKAEGYSFGEIEKALMEVVKRGAAPLPTGAELGMPPGPAQMPQPQPSPAQPPVEARPQSVYAPPAYEYSPAPAYPELAEEELQPEVIMEDLIESVTEEKFEKFAAHVKKMEETLDKLRSELSVTREKAEAKPAPEIPRELSERLDSMEVRLGGLEKAFRQFLPQLKENIESISRMVAEKKRQFQQYK